LIGYTYSFKEINMTKIRNAFLMVFVAAILFVGTFAPVIAEAQSCDPRYFNRSYQPYFTGASNVDPSYSHPANRYPPGHPGHNGNWNGVHPGGGYYPPAGWGGAGYPAYGGGNTDVWGNVGYRNGQIGVSGGYRTFDPATGTSHGGSVYSDTYGNSGGNWGFNKRQ
jgi:hypothetical protein